jgi:inorganic pyrophosphatase
MPQRSSKRLSDLDAIDRDSKCILVVVETPRGGRTKLAYDPDREAFVVKKVLPEGMSFPFDFGFIPSTLGEDGDPLDVLVLMDEPVATGSVVPSRLIGVIEATQKEKGGKPEENARLVAVSEACLLFAEVKRLTDLPDAVVTQIEHFFVAYNEQEGKVFKPTGRHGPKRAATSLDTGRRRFKRGRKK